MQPPHLNAQILCLLAASMIVADAVGEKQVLEEFQFVPIFQVRG